MALIGYARVSTKDQETHLQLDALAKAGVLEVRQEKGSSVGPRPELQRLLGQLQPGDVLVVYKMDRIARSLKDLLAILGRLKLLSLEQELAVLSMVDGGATQSATARHFKVSLIVVRRLLAERKGQKNTGVYPVLKKYLED